MSGKRNKQQRQRRAEEIMANEPNVLLDKQVALVHLTGAIEGMEAACVGLALTLSSIRETISGAKVKRKKLADEVEALKKAGNGNAEQAVNAAGEAAPDAEATA